MTNDEIIRSYKNAVNPKEQVNILCELTLKPREEIVRILKAAGCAVEPAALPENSLKKRISDETIATIRRLRSEGATFKEITEKTGCASETIRRYIGPEETKRKTSIAHSSKQDPKQMPDAPANALELALQLNATALEMLRKFAEATGNMEFWYSSDRYSFELVIEDGFMRMEVSEKMEENCHD